MARASGRHLEPAESSNLTKEQIAALNEEFGLGKKAKEATAEEIKERRQAAAERLRPWVELPKMSGQMRAWFVID